jgi:hypothetical protein
VEVTGRPVVDSKVVLLPSIGPNVVTCPDKVEKSGEKVVGPVKLVGPVKPGMVEWWWKTGMLPPGKIVAPVGVTETRGVDDTNGVLERKTGVELKGDPLNGWTLNGGTLKGGIEEAPTGRVTWCP